MALGLPALGQSAENTRATATETTLTAETHDGKGGTQAALSVAVTGVDGTPASGTAVLEDLGKPLAGIALDAEGRATTTLAVPQGDHALKAVYSGDATHQSSTSAVTPVRAAAAAIFNFSVSVAPASLSLNAGQSGTVVASVTPINASTLPGPIFITLSCSGLPDQSACTFTPENIGVLPSSTAPINSTMVLATSNGIAATARMTPGDRQIQPTARPVAWAVLLPGVLGLAGLAFSARRRRWLARLSLLALVGFISVLGATACSPLYDYNHHGPPHNLPTPAGTYTVNITAQSSNGITAITNSTTVALTVTDTARN